MQELQFLITFPLIQSV